jgi:hypothetical protein
MKRLALLLTILATGASVWAADDVEIKNSGEFRARYTNYINASGSGSSDQMSGTEGRLKWNVSARKGEKLQVFVSLIHNSIFGAEGSDTGKYTSVTTDRNLLIVNRAWGWWKATDSVSLKVGRFGIQIADGAFFDENDWDPYPTSFEGANIAWDMDWAKLNFYAVQTHDFSAPNFNGRGTNPPAATTIPENNSNAGREFYMISGDFKNLPEAIKTANLHVVQISKDASSPDVANGVTGSQNFQHIGLALDGELVGFTYKFDGAFQTGTFNNMTTAANPALPSNISATMFDISAGYHRAETMGLKVTANFHADTGANGTSSAAYQPLYYDGHSYAGLMDVVGWGNLTYYDLTASIMPMEDFEVGAGYYMFSRSNSGDTTTNPFAGGRYANSVGGLGTNGIGGFSSDSAIGSEADVWAAKTYDSGVKVGLRYGAFMPSDFMKNGTVARSNTIQEVMAQGSMAF